MKLKNLISDEYFRFINIKIFLKLFLALVCAPYYGGRNCELYDGETIREGPMMRHKHWWGSLAMYEGKPTAIGAWNSSKVEQLNEEWIELPDHPR